MIAEDIASIDTNQDSEEKNGLLDGILGEVFHDLKDTQLINAAAVSYTHLDVYKRQVPYG